jgi:biopolymer transport protein ExbD
MPSVKLPRKSTDTDMTPFVDVAFLILAFFIMATKFKPPEPVDIVTPKSVSAEELPENDAILITVDSINRVFFSVLAEKEPQIMDEVIQGLNTSRSLNLSPAEMQNFRKTYAVGVPFSSLKSYLAMDQASQGKVNQPGIPVMDTLNNELVWWIAEAKKAFASNSRPLRYLIKGDGSSKYPAFEAVIAALKKNDQFKYNLVTALENAPSGTALDVKIKKGIK